MRLLSSEHPRSGISEIVSSRLPRSLLARVVLKFVPGYNFQVTVIRKGGLFSRSPFCAGSKDDLYIILLKFLWNLTTDDDLSYILPQDLYPCPSLHTAGSGETPASSRKTIRKNEGSALSGRFERMKCV
jgi:hypothetical protein